MIQLITLILLGRLLPLKELGAYAIFSIVFRFALYSLDPGMFFSMIQQHHSSKQLFRRLMARQWFYMFISVFVFGLIWLLTDMSRNTGSVIIVNSLLIIIIIGAGASVQSQMVRDFRQREIVLVQMIAYTIELVFVVVAVAYFDAVMVFSCGVVLRFILFYGISWFFISVKSSGADEVSLEEMQKMERSSHYNIWSQILSFVQGQYDTVIIVGLFGLSTLGGYILMTEISYMIFAKINPLFNRAIIPVISKALLRSENVDELTRESLRSFLYIIFTLYWLFWMYRTEVIQFAYPDKSADLIYYATFLIPVAFARSINNILVSYVLSLGETRRIFVWNITILIINYLVIILFYLFKGSLESFLWFGIGYGIISAIMLWLLFARLLKEHHIATGIFHVRQVCSFALITLSVWMSHLVITNFVLSLCSSLLLILLVFYFLEKQRLVNWLKLSMV
ncbi:MAG: oligosaccharide flippase family protein [Saprospiraceae bacterium]|nr:oligosaccharide flippase family protein [Saprospiraceae bacterium]